MEKEENALPRFEESSSSETNEVVFSLTGIRDGYLQCLPVALGVGGYGIVFGVLARQAGLSTGEAVLMSATVLAGAAQLIAMEMWTDPIPAVALVGTTFVVNLRYLLMGAALRPWFTHLTAAQAYASIFFTADENWALTISEFRTGSRHGSFLLGSGLAIWSFWVTATVVGAVVGGAIEDPARFGLDFVLTAIFLAIAVDLWEGRSDFLPWAGAAGVAVITAQILPGYWYIVSGGLCGFFVGVVRYDE
ncbi:AzlC family ABC transporter permease [Halegenticoccus soli]|uniref:AzlC family ABC transporter permease n=1 Tax=Halegenticoccus soli TaxID=1985678 RepID=UPI000C6D2748|nr:AzlC family ABC transporter permease [Halegenticoccus soli]